MNDNKYKILSIYQLNNILCINNDLCKLLDINSFNSDIYIKNLYKKEYIDNTERTKILPWNDNINYWLNINDRELLKTEITNYFVFNNDRSKFKNKNKIKDVDFYIE